MKDFSKGDFILEYTGVLTDKKTAKKIELEYSKDKDKGCFMFYFNWYGRILCINATAESDRMGRLINHGRKRYNCVPKVLLMGNKPRLYFVASEKILAGTEVLYDYGER
jgi:histone-lysine N-methyltransferase SETD8